MAAKRGAAAPTRSPKEPFPIYAIVGTDSYLISQARREILRKALGNEPDPMAICEFEGRTAALADVLDELRSPSLLAPLRVVIVREADPFVSSARANLEEYLENPSTTGVLVLQVRTWPSNTRLYRAAQAIGRNIACEAPKRAALPGWIKTRATEGYQCAMAPGAAERLADLVGSQCGRLDAELAKLASYVAPATQITRADVDALVGSSREERVFGIADAIVERKPATALAMWHQVLATDRDAPYRAMGGLAWGFRRLTAARRMLESGENETAIARSAGFWGSPNEFCKQIKRLSVAQWEDSLTALLSADIGTKTGLTETERAVERIIVQMCAPPARGRP